MNTYCKVTGQIPCQCPDRDPHKNALGSALLVDLRLALRKLFKDHTVYTSLLILASVPVLQPDADAFRRRLLQNPGDIYNLLAPVVGDAKAAPVRDLFTEHLVIADSLLKPVRTGAPTDQGVATFYAQGDRLSAALSNLNPAKLPYGQVAPLIRGHNERVVNLALLRNQQRFDDYVLAQDEYFKHMSMLADTLYSAFM